MKLIYHQPGQGQGEKSNEAHPRVLALRDQSIEEIHPKCMPIRRSTRSIKVNVNNDFDYEDCHFNRSYDLNKMKAIKQKLDACDNQPATFEVKKKGQLRLKFSAAGYEAFRESVMKFYNQDKDILTHGELKDISIKHESVYDRKGEAIVEEHYKIFNKLKNGNVGNRNKFTINLYHTTSSALVNGVHAIDLFANVHLRIIANHMLRYDIYGDDQMLRNVLAKLTRHGGYSSSTEVSRDDDSAVVCATASSLHPVTATHLSNTDRKFINSDKVKQITSSSAHVRTTEYELPRSLIETPSCVPQSTEMCESMREINQTRQPNETNWKRTVPAVTGKELSTLQPISEEGAVEDICAEPVPGKLNNQISQMDCLVYQSVKPIHSSFEGARSSCVPQSTEMCENMREINQTRQLNETNWKRTVPAVTGKELSTLQPISEEGAVEDICAEPDPGKLNNQISQMDCLVYQSVKPIHSNFEGADAATKSSTVTVSDNDNRTAPASIGKEPSIQPSLEKGVIIDINAGPAPGKSNNQTSQMDCFVHQSVKPIHSSFEVADAAAKSSTIIVSDNDNGTVSASIGKEPSIQPSFEKGVIIDINAGPAPGKFNNQTSQMDCFVHQSVKPIYSSSEVADAAAKSSTIVVSDNDNGTVSASIGKEPSIQPSFEKGVIIDINAGPAPGKFNNQISQMDSFVHQSVKPTHSCFEVADAATKSSTVTVSGNNNRIVPAHSTLEVAAVVTENSNLMESDYDNSVPEIVMEVDSGISVSDANQQEQKKYAGKKNVYSNIKAEKKRLKKKSSRKKARNNRYMEKRQSIDSIPAAQYPCGVCHMETEGSECIECSRCLTWSHRVCQEIDPTRFASLTSDASSKYACLDCRKRMEDNNGCIDNGATYTLSDGNLHIDTAWKSDSRSEDMQQTSDKMEIVNNLSNFADGLHDLSGCFPDSLSLHGATAGNDHHDTDNTLRSALSEKDNIPSESHPKMKRQTDANKDGFKLNSYSVVTPRKILKDKTTSSFNTVNSSNEDELSLTLNPDPAARLHVDSSSFSGHLPICDASAKSDSDSVNLLQSTSNDKENLPCVPTSNMMSNQQTVQVKENCKLDSQAEDTRRRTKKKTPSCITLHKTRNEKETSSTLDKSELTDVKELKNLERRLKSWEKRLESRHAELDSSGKDMNTARKYIHQLETHVNELDRSNAILRKRLEHSGSNLHELQEDGRDMQPTHHPNYYNRNQVCNSQQSDNSILVNLESRIQQLEMATLQGRLSRLETMFENLQNSNCQNYYHGYPSLMRSFPYVVPPLHPSFTPWFNPFLHQLQNNNISRYTQPPKYYNHVVNNTDNLPPRNSNLSHSNSHCQPQMDLHSLNTHHQRQMNLNQPHKQHQRHTGLCSSTPQPHSDAKGDQPCTQNQYQTDLNNLSNQQDAKNQRRMDVNASTNQLQRQTGGNLPSDQRQVQVNISKSTSIPYMEGNQLPTQPQRTNPKTSIANLQRQLETNQQSTQPKRQTAMQPTNQLCLNLDSNQSSIQFQRQEDPYHSDRSSLNHLDSHGLNEPNVVNGTNSDGASHEYGNGKREERKFSRITSNDYINCGSCHRRDVRSEEKQLTEDTSNDYSSLDRYKHKDVRSQDVSLQRNSSIDYSNVENRWNRNDRGKDRSPREDGSNCYTNFASCARREVRSKLWKSNRHSTKGKVQVPHRDYRNSQHFLERGHTLKEGWP